MSCHAGCFITSSVWGLTHGSCIKMIAYRLSASMFSTTDLPLKQFSCAMRSVDSSIGGERLLVLMSSGIVSNGLFGGIEEEGVERELKLKL